MRWSIWAKYYWIQMHSIWARRHYVTSLSEMAEAKERLGINLMAIDEEAVRETAEVKDPFDCPSCASEVLTSRVEVSDISRYVIQSIHHGYCSACGRETEFENRFYDGQMAAKVNGEWHIVLVVPSKLDRLRAWLGG
jgi:hypothetical protein